MHRAVFQLQLRGFAGSLPRSLQFLLGANLAYQRFRAKGVLVNLMLRASIRGVKRAISALNKNDLLLDDPFRDKSRQINNPNPTIRVQHQQIIIAQDDRVGISGER